MTGPHVRHPERGVALLEVLVALAILGLTAGALVGAVGGVLRAQTMSERAEREARRVDQLLTGLSFLTRDELDARLGVTRVGGYAIRIERTRPSLYRIGVRIADRPVADELVTILRRAEAR